MKKILLIIVLLISNFVYADNVKDTTLIVKQDYDNLMLDSLTFFTLVDSLKEDEYTEFEVSEMLTYINDQYEYNHIFNNLIVNQIPWDYIAVFSSNTYYPKTEYINEGIHKKYNNMYFYITYDELSFAYIIYWLKPI